MLLYLPPTTKQMKLFKINANDKLAVYLLTAVFAIVNLVWAFYSDNTWDDDCPGRYQNTLNAFVHPEHFVSLWNRPLFVVIFSLPVQLGAWTIPVLQTMFSIIAGFSLYQVANHFKLRFAYLALPLLWFQPFVFGVSKYAMTEPLAITLICLSLWLQLEKKWSWFALCAGLLPLARLELAVFFPFYIIPILQNKAYKSLIMLAVPGLVWALAAGIIHNDPLWLLNETIFKESGENRYGNQQWHTYLSRYGYVIGPVILLFSVLGINFTSKNKHLRYYILAPFLIGFFVYTLFSWKLSLGNAAGFLRNIIPISPYITIIALAGIHAWFVFSSKKSISVTKVKAPSKMKNWLQKASRFNKVIGNGKFYGFITITIMVAITYLYYTHELKLHHKLSTTDYDYSLFTGVLSLAIITSAGLLLNRKLFKIVLPSAIIITLLSHTLITEHPMANANDERTVVSEVANLYTKIYLSEKQTFVNHPWFIWSGKLDRYAGNLNYMVKDSLKGAKAGDIAIFDTHYCNRLGSDVSSGYMASQKDWVELARFYTPKNNFVMNAFEKVNSKADYLPAHMRYLAATDSLEKTGFLCLGFTYLNHLNDLEKAYNAFAKSVNIDSLYTEGFMGLGLVMNKKNNPKAAIEFFNKALSINEKHHLSQLNKGVSYLNLKDNKAAIYTLKKATETNKKNHQAWFYLGIAYFQAKKNAEALKAYESCLKLNPKFPQAWFNVAVAQMQMKQQKAACQNMKKAADLGFKRAQQMLPQICK